MPHKRMSNYSMDRNMAEANNNSSRAKHVGGQVEMSNSAGVSVAIPLGSNCQDTSIKNMKISFVGDQALLLQH